jgi:hypothetical protein
MYLHYFQFPHKCNFFKKFSENSENFPRFWVIVFLILVYVQVSVSLHLYFAERFEFKKIFYFLKKMVPIRRPSNGVNPHSRFFLIFFQFRFGLILIGNILNFSFTIYFAISELILGVTQDFPSCIL